MGIKIRFNFSYLNNIWLTKNNGHYKLQNFLDHSLTASLYLYLYSKFLLKYTNIFIRQCYVS